MSVDDTRFRVTPNLAYGICLVLLGGTLILDRLQVIEASQILRFWPAALVLIGLTLVIQSFQRVDPAAPQQNFNPGPVILLVAIGLLFSHGLQRNGISARETSGDTVSVFAVMSHHQQVSAGPSFRGGDLTSVMGRSDLDLRQTTVAPGEEVEIEVFTLMGGSTIRVPEGWTVVIRAVPVMGGVKDRRMGPRDVPGAPRIVVRGLIVMGGLDIRS